MKRQPKGTRIGGEFATETRSDDVDGLDTSAEAFEPQEAAFDNFQDAVPHAEGFTRRGQWAVIEHTHTYHEDEVVDGGENEATSDDVFEVTAFDSYSDFEHWVESNGMLRNRFDDSDRTTFSAEVYQDPYSDEATEHRGTLYEPVEIIDDQRRQQLREKAAEAIYDYETTIDGDPLDSQIHTVDEDILDEARDDFDDFVQNNNALLTRLHTEHPEYDLDQLPYDFHLSRNGHGAGFFDRGLGDVGDELQNTARVYGSLDVLVDGGTPSQDND